jgi:hypothetical protein
VEIESRRKWKRIWVSDLGSGSPDEKRGYMDMTHMMSCAYTNMVVNNELGHMPIHNMPNFNNQAIILHISCKVFIGWFWSEPTVAPSTSKKRPQIAGPDGNRVYGALRKRRCIWRLSGRGWEPVGCVFCTQASESRPGKQSNIWTLK